MSVASEVRQIVGGVFVFIIENPIVAMVLTAAFVIVVGLIARYLHLEYGVTASRFRSLLEQYDEVGVLMHPNPDPDAMASALAVKEIADQFGVSATIYYSGQVRHHQNRAFVTVLDLDLVDIESVSEIEEENVVLVDHGDPRGFQAASTLEPVAVVDHHPDDVVDAEFTDVRPDVGSCATILTEYLRDLGWQVSDEDESDGDEKVLTSDLATALLFGIQSDTDDLTNGCSSLDFDVLDYLYDGVDRVTLDRVANPEIDAESLNIKSRAIQQHETRSAFAVSDVGEVSNLDAIPQAADELRRLEGINAVVVFGEKDDTIHFSARSNDDRVHIGQVCENVVEDIPLASAGGHARMGGGRFDVEYMEEYGAEDETMTREEFYEKLFVEMNGGE